MLKALEGTNSIYVLVTFMVVNTFFCLFFINKYMEQKKINARLKALKDTPPEKVLKEFFLSQNNKTKSLKSKKDDNFNITHDIANMRMAYLRIELNALNSPINTAPYWESLIKNLDKLFGILSPQRSNKSSPKNDVLEKVKMIKGRLEELSKTCKDSKSATTREKLAKNMDVLYKKLETSDLDTKKLEKYHKKLELIANTFEDPELRGPHLTKKSKEQHHTQKQSALEKISQHCEDNSATLNYTRNTTLSDPINPEILSKLNTYEKENDRLTRYVNRLKQQLESLHLNDLDSDKSASSNPAESESALDDEIIASNEQEIARLRSVVKSQRNAILDLEELTNSTAHINEDESEKYNMEIAQLKRSAAESEMCVNVLEDELDHLRASFKNNQAPEKMLTAHEIEQLNNEVIALKEELTKTEALNNQYTSLLEFVFDALSASSIEDISLLLHESLLNLKFSPLVLVKSTDRIIELFDNNTLSVREQTLITSLQLNEINPKNNGQLIFRLTNLSGLLHPYTDLENPQEMHNHIIQILKLSDTVISQILLTQKNKSGANQITASITQIQNVSLEIDEMIETFLKTAKSIVDDSFGQIKSTARAKGLNATQVASFQAIEQDALSQIKFEDTIRPKIRKKFLGLINALERE